MLPRCTTPSPTSMRGAGSMPVDISPNSPQWCRSSRTSLPPSAPHCGSGIAICWRIARAPTAAAAVTLRTRLTDLVTQRTGYRALDDRLARFATNGVLLRAKPAQHARCTPRSDAHAPPPQPRVPAWYGIFLDTLSAAEQHGLRDRFCVLALARRCLCSVAFTTPPRNGAGVAVS